ncbi:hypothetical protein HID58_034389, partial [Brassica napus]
MTDAVVYPKANQKPCKNFDISFKSRVAGLPTFVLVNREGLSHLSPSVADDYLQNITSPSAVARRSLGSAIKTSIAHAYKLRTKSNDECGSKYDAQIRFLKRFKGAAQILEKEATLASLPTTSPGIVPEAFLAGRQCKSQYINRGRYCAPDSEQDFSRGYNGKDVIVQSLCDAPPPPNPWGVRRNAVVYPKANQKPCKNFDISFKSRVAGLPTFVLVNREGLERTTNLCRTILVVDNRPEPLITITHGEPVHISLDWREALPHPNYRVAYKLRTKSNDECGSKYDAQIRFLKRFKGAAQILEKEATLASLPTTSPGIVPEPFLAGRQCKSQYINRGRYCAPDSEQDFSRGYNGKDVIVQ